MTDSLKVQSHHLQRDAYLYIRQSSMRQVVENIESTKRQYALRARAIAMGWPDDRVIVIDCDQGESGASAAWREGFRRLVTEVGLGRAGIVMGLEVSRLARNNADWHRLLEICALADTLILDEDGVYDPANFNDRLLLGLKGAMSEAELHVLKARLRGGLLNKARRGEYRCILPTGLVYDEAGNVALDPDEQVRESARLLFRDVFPRRLRPPDDQGFSRRGPALSLSPPQRRREGGLPTADDVDRHAHPEQPALCGRLCLRAATLSPHGGGAQNRTQAPIERLDRLPSQRSSWLHHVGPISGESAHPGKQRPRIRVWRAVLPRGRARRSCRDVRSAECAGSTSASNTSTKPREAGWSHGTFVIVRAASRARPTASRSPAAPSTKRSGGWWPKG